MTQLYRRISVVTLLSCFLFLTTGCAVTLVQPYDEKLLADTEALFKKASTVIDDGIAKSPKTENERNHLKAAASTPNSVTPLASNPAHFTQFESRYNDLTVDVDALILRSLSKAAEVGPLGQKLQKRIEDLINQAIPSACDDLQSEFGAMTSSLTVMNYVDLKCLLIRWKAQHGDVTVTNGTGILKKVNWELRKSAVFAATLAIEQAETSKKK